VIFTDDAPARRLLLVHAHPDDESLGTGATMARYVDEGAHVTLVTCTSGEEGEVVLPSLAHLAADKDDALGPHRQIELAAAMQVLGVTDHRFLGGPGVYRDSGMMGTPSNDRSECFWRADLLEAARHLVTVIREVRPQVLVTYDDFGGYGHPDHINAHRVAMYAAALAAAASFAPELGKPWDITKIYWTAFPRSVFLAQARRAIEAGMENPLGEFDLDDAAAVDGAMPWAVDDALVTTAIDGQNFVSRKVDALKAHATQINVEDGWFALSNDNPHEVFGVEYFRIAKGQVTGPLDSEGRETDLFAGVD
jgi:N-acetyl-1-D-myo-inositol-2-amino-2-deoxy-alpha-D-glucopyranoside deacetylase